ncbi:hypothetical protein F511_05221 [Dorcoceras hygrometricum]|uniref:DUF868 domain-containing protein n=1 Tax=Dorcoceras hygrometricum TaxID=472368 RepID=A0A2Z7CJA7_9LAMI|nr:hypothetical protein F511_05221 [Dorcoceras hygrometricum]
MIDLSSCLSESALQISDRTSCSRNSNISCISPNSVPSTQNTVTCLYRAILSTQEQILITVTWSKNSLFQGLNITIGEDPSVSIKVNTNSRLFRKLKGSKSLEFNGCEVEVSWDFSSARYRSMNEPEPVDGYYIIITFDSGVGMFIGDKARETLQKQAKSDPREAKFSLLTRREHFSGNTHYQTKAKFCETGAAHDILIRRGGENERMKNSELSVSIDKKMVIRVKSLQWNFRGNQTIFLDGLLVDLMWNVDDWFRNPDSGHGVFMFRTRSGRDSGLWMAQKDDKDGFSLIIFAAACKNM